MRGGFRSRAIGALVAPVGLWFCEVWGSGGVVVVGVVVGVCSMHVTL